MSVDGGEGLKETLRLIRESKERLRFSDTESPLESLHRALDQYKTTPKEADRDELYGLAIRLIVTIDQKEINKAKDDGKTPLHKAAEIGDDRLCARLLAKGADPAIKDSEGKTPLHHLAEKNPEKFFDLLVFSDNQSKDAQKKLFESLTIEDDSGKRPLAIIARSTGKNEEYFQNLDKNITAVLKKGGLVNKSILERITEIFEKIGTLFKKTEAQKLYEQTADKKQQQSESLRAYRLFNGMKQKLERQTLSSPTATAPAAPSPTRSASKSSSAARG